MLYIYSTKGKLPPSPGPFIQETPEWDEAIQTVETRTVIVLC